jgi:hypothetical protein
MNTFSAAYIPEKHLSASEVLKEILCNRFISEGLTTFGSGASCAGGGPAYDNECTVFQVLATSLANFRRIFLRRNNPIVKPFEVVYSNFFRSNSMLQAILHS